MAAYVAYADLFVLKRFIFREVTGGKNKQYV